MNGMTKAECAQQRYKARFKIREVLDDQDITMNELGRRIGLSGQIVQRTVQGKSHSPRVLEALRQVGVPENLLFDPRA
jgi:transcriptional regulator with XRE-family HTH domain